MMWSRHITRRARPRASMVQGAVRGLVEAVVIGELGTQLTAVPGVLDQAVAVMIQKIDDMPGYMSVGIIGLTATLDRLGPVPLHRRPVQQRIATFRGWQRSPVGLLRTFTDFYGKMGVFVYCALLEDRDEAVVQRGARRSMDGADPGGVV